MDDTSFKLDRPSSLPAPHLETGGPLEGYSRQPSPLAVATGSGLVCVAVLCVYLGGMAYLLGINPFPSKAAPPTALPTAQPEPASQVMGLTQEWAASPAAVPGPAASSAPLEEVRSELERARQQLAQTEERLKLLERDRPQRPAETVLTPPAASEKRAPATPEPDPGAQFEAVNPAELSSVSVPAPPSAPEAPQAPVGSPQAAVRDEPPPLPAAEDSGPQFLPTERRPSGFR